MRRATNVNWPQAAKDLDFYPRSPCGERRSVWDPLPLYRDISIHALLAESDHGRAAGKLYHQDFYPRSPCGERHVTMPAVSALVLFLSTLSLRRATRLRGPAGSLPRFLSTLSLRRATILSLQGICSGSISIHALLAESDGIVAQHDDCMKLFLSTLSLRRATQGQNFRDRCHPFYFYPRSPCGERRREKGDPFREVAISIHALLAESDV